MNSRRIPRSLTSGRTITPLASGVVTRERLAARTAAAKQIAKAEEKAREILEQAERERDRARQAGLEEGRRDGERELAQRLAKVAQIEDITADRHLPGLVELAGQMAARLLRRELKLHPESIRCICRGVIRENRPGQRIKMLVNPGELDHLQDEKNPLTTDPDVRIEIEASQKIEPGGCIVLSELGKVDASISAQLEELERALKEADHDR